MSENTPVQLKFIGSPVTEAYNPGHGHNTGMLFSFKNKRSLPWRGILERDAMILWDVDPDVESFSVEPITIPYRMPAGRPSVYTPDRLVHFCGERPSLLVEIKPKRNLRKHRALWKAKFEAAEQEALSRGWQFEVWTEEHVRGTILENATFLRAYFAYPDRVDLQKRLFAEMRVVGETTGNDLLSRVATDSVDRGVLLPELWKAIALGAFEVNWKKPVNLHSRIKCLETEVSC
jgi:hypothetical protein